MQLNTLLEHMNEMQPLVGSVTPSATAAAAAATTQASAAAMHAFHSAKKPLAERLLTLNNGRTLQFTLDCVPDPPAISFATNIPYLNGMWDFDPAHWQGTSCLIVKGHHIPVAYWPELYKYGKKDQWKGMKTRWFEWKV